MPTATLRDLTTALAAGDWPPVILVSGDDPELRRAALATILEALPDEERMTAVDRFDEGPLVRALDAARSPSLLGGRRIVVVDEPAALGAGAGEERDALAAWLEAPAPHATLVLLASRADGRLAVVKAIAKRGVRIEAARPKEREMPAWIGERARARGLRLTPQIAQAIADAVGTDPALAAREIDKLLLVRGDRPGAGPPDLDTVEALLRPGRAVGAFALEDALLAGRTAEALRLLDRHLAGAGAGAGEPLALLGRLAGIARRLAVAADVARRGGGQQELREALSCHPFVAKKYAEAGRRVGARAGAAMAACVAADGMLKSGREPRAALGRVVTALAPAAAGPPRGRSAPRHRRPS